MKIVEQTNYLILQWKFPTKIHKNHYSIIYKIICIGFYQETIVSSTFFLYPLYGIRPFIFFVFRPPLPTKPPERLVALGTFCVFGEGVGEGVGIDVGEIDILDGDIDIIGLFHHMKDTNIHHYSMGSLYCNTSNNTI